MLTLAAVPLATADLQQQVQTIIDSVAKESGYSFSVGFKDSTLSFGVGAGPRSPSGLPTVAGTVSGTDTMLLGSGTKPYTAAAVMRLVEKGKVSLTDPAAKHIDPVLQRMNGTSFASLFGPKASAVTVGHLLSMRSGIGDFDIPSYDNKLLVAGNKVHSVLEPLKLVASFSDPNGCDPGRSGDDKSCTFVCDPGSCTSYSSTNYVLAGLVLLAHAPASQHDVSTYDQIAALGLRPEDYPHTFTPTQGPMNTTGLDVAGASEAYGKAELFSQDASILGWTCGNVVASAQDVAHFYWDLLGPSHSVVSDASLKTMSTMHTLDRGWAAGAIPYGYGLMIQNVDPEEGRRLPSLDNLASYIGHGGDTYAFMSDNGYFPALNASISVIVNEDSDSRFPSYSATCRVVEVIAKAKGLLSHDLKCIPPGPEKYVCHSFLGRHQCYPDWHGGGTSKEDCEKSCTKETASPLRAAHGARGA